MNPLAGFALITTAIAIGITLGLLISVVLP